MHDERWAARSSAVAIGAVAGALNGVLSATLLVWATPDGHWIRESWAFVGIGYAGLMAGVWILILLFIWKLAFGTPRKF